MQIEGNDRQRGKIDDVSRSCYWSRNCCVMPADRLFSDGPMLLPEPKKKACRGATANGLLRHPEKGLRDAGKEPQNGRQPAFDRKRTLRNHEFQPDPEDAGSGRAERPERQRVRMRQVGSWQRKWRHRQFRVASQNGGRRDGTCPNKSGGNRLQVENRLFVCNAVVGVRKRRKLSRNFSRR